MSKALSRFVGKVHNKASFNKNVYRRKVKGIGTVYESRRRGKYYFLMKEHKKVPKKVNRFIAKHIAHHIEDLGLPQNQAVAVAFVEARKKYPNYANRLRAKRDV